MDYKKYLTRRLLKAVYKDILRCLVIYIFLDFAIFPYFCGKWHDSRYFKYSEGYVDLIVEEKNEERQLKAENDLAQISSENSLKFYSSNNGRDLKILVLVLTVKRARADYLLQTVVALDEQIKILNQVLDMSSIKFMEDWGKNISKLFFIIKKISHLSFSKIEF